MIIVTDNNIINMVYYIIYGKIESLVIGYLLENAINT